MKIFIVRMALVLVISISMFSICIASSNTWTCGFSTSSDEQYARSMTAIFGTNPLASNDYDSSDILISSGRDLYVASYHDGQTWTGSSGFYRYDNRAPISPGKSMTWTIYVWAESTAPVNESYIILEFGNNIIPDNTSFTLTLKSKPIGIFSGPSVGTSWDLLNPPYGVYLPIYRTTNGLDGYVFDFTATVIPEPSSLLALLAGLGGFSGMMWRRKMG